MSKVLLRGRLWVLVLTVSSSLIGSALAQDQPQPTGWQEVPVQPVMDGGMLVVPMQPVVEGPAPNGAVAAMLALDPKYIAGIVEVSGPGGSPVPRQWIILARDSNDQGTLHKITVADGQVINDSTSLNVIQAMRQKVGIDPQSVQVDSGDAFMIAEPIAAANSQIIGRTDYVLGVRAADSVPIWTLNCFDMNGGFIGKVILLATTGNVLETPGFRIAPPQQ